MIGRSKKDKNKEVEAVAPVEAVAVVPEPTFFEIGKNGTVEEFRAANQKALDNTNSNGYHCGADNQRELQKGALAGFKEGSVENLQIVVANPAEFMIRDSYALTEAVDCVRILSGLTKGSDYPAAVISLAIEAVPEQKKQQLLDNALYSAVARNCYSGEETFIAALLTVGANANAVSDGSAGRILAVAIDNGHPPSVIKLLHENGASFDDALLRIRTKSFWDKDDRRALCIGKLKAYREAITGQPATVEVNPEVMQQLLDQVAEITRRLPPQTPETAPRKQRKTTATTTPAP